MKHCKKGAAIICRGLTLKGDEWGVDILIEVRVLGGDWEKSLSRASVGSLI